LSQICGSSSIGTSSVVIVVVVVVAVVIIIIIIISKSLRQYLSNILGKHEIKELQKKKKISLIVHCTHTTESATVKIQNTFHRRNNVTCSTNCKYRTVAALYTLETWFVSGI
jgi:predicted Holliday junction resolvase-like endonuclease